MVVTSTVHGNDGWSPPQDSAEANENEEIGPQTTVCFGRDFITKHRARIRRITGSGGGTPWSPSSQYPLRCSSLESGSPSEGHARAIPIRRSGPARVSRPAPSRFAAAGLGSSGTKFTSQSVQWVKPERYSAPHSGQNMHRMIHRDRSRPSPD
jgi:hypothetical protein